MTPADLARLHAACFTVPRPWAAGEFAALLAHPGCLLLTEPEGFALLRVAGDEAELLTLAVAPASRRQGIGRRLLASACTAAAARGAQALLLEVAADNAAARALYAATGFAIAGRRPRYYRAPDGAVDALVLRKPLQAG